MGLVPSWVILFSRGSKLLSRGWDVFFRGSNIFSGGLIFFLMGRDFLSWFEYFSRESKFVLAREKRLLSFMPKVSFFHKITRVILIDHD